jgi:Fe-S cluster assembly iron-binding protein IscA
MNYGMTFAEQVEGHDRLLENQQGFRLVVDPVAYSFMEGAEIDFVDDGVSSTFVFNNVFQAVGGSGACGGCGGAI